MAFCLHNALTLFLFLLSGGQGAGSPGLYFDPSRARENPGQSRRGRRGQAGGRVDPVDPIDFVAHPGFACRPAGDERGDDEMGADAAALMGDRLQVAVEADDFGIDADLLHKLAGDSLSERLADFDHAARKTEMPDQRRPRPPDDQDPPVPEHRRRYGEDRAGGKQSVIHRGFHGFGACRRLIANPDVRRR